MCSDCWRPRWALLQGKTTWVWTGHWVLPFWNEVRNHIKITRKWQFKILRKNVAVINLTATLQKAMTAGGQKESMTSFVTLIY